MTGGLSWVMPRRQRKKHKADNVSIVVPSTPVAKSPDVVELDAGPVQLPLGGLYTEHSPGIYPRQVFQLDPKPIHEVKSYSHNRSQSAESSQLATLIQSGFVDSTGQRSPPPPYSAGDLGTYIGWPLAPSLPTHIFQCQTDSKTKDATDRIARMHAELRSKPLPRRPSNMFDKVELLDQESLDRKPCCTSSKSSESDRSCTSRASLPAHRLTVNTLLANNVGKASRPNVRSDSSSSGSSPSSGLVSRYSPWYSPLRPIALPPSKNSRITPSIPATIFESRGEVWIFPNVTATKALAIISQAISRSYSTVMSLKELTDSGGQGRVDGRYSASSSSATTPVSASTPSPSSVGKSNKRRRRSGGRDDENAKHPRTQLCQEESERRSPPPKYGCPFEKRNPARYQNVYNSCTFPPGKDWKYLIEHLTKVHRMSQRCIYCHQRWTENWEQEVNAHLQVCPKKHTIMTKPEYMTAAQEAVYNASPGDDSHPDKKWTMLYMRLWPGEYPIPPPWYDHFIARHELITPANSTTPSSDSGFEDSIYPQLRTWRIYSRNGTVNSSSGSSEASPSLALQDGRLPYSAPPATSVPLMYPTLPVASNPLDVPANYLAGGMFPATWSQDTLVDPNQSLYELGDPSMMESDAVVYYPFPGVTGEEFLDVWTGQVMGSMAML